MPDRQPLDAHLREFLEEQAANAPDLPAMPDAERVHAHRKMLLHALGSREEIPGLPNEVQSRDLTAGNDRPARLYQPANHGHRLRPLLVYLHGGGWVAGSFATHDPFCRLLAHAADVAILSVDYRQPPEHRFPAALDDSLAGFHWAAEHANELGFDPARLAIGGDSAGGNLAAVAASILAATPDAPKLRAQMLLFPVTDHPSANHHSYAENATGYGLTAESMRWFWNQYAPGVDPHEAGISPLRLEAVPALSPTLIFTAEYDVLRDEGLAYADKLKHAGVAVTHFHAGDMHHDFPVSPATVARFPQCETSLNHIAGWLRAMLHIPLPASHQARSEDR